MGRNCPAQWLGIGPPPSGSKIKRRNDIAFAFDARHRVVPLHIGGLARRQGFSDFLPGAELLQVG